MRNHSVTFFAALLALSSCNRSLPQDAPDKSNKVANAAGGKDCQRGGIWGKDTYRPKPYFPGQTDAPAPTYGTNLKVEVIARGLDHPWSLAALPDGGWLLTERSGQMKIVNARGQVSAPLMGPPAVKHIASDGLTDVRLDKDFQTNRTLYFLYLAPTADGRLTGPNSEYQKWASLPFGQHDLHPLGRRTLASAQLSPDSKRLINVDTILEGGNRRIVQASDGSLFITADPPTSLSKPIGNDAQNLGSLYGKVIRINRDGSIPKDNPFFGKAGVRPEIYSYGHKDPEGAALNPSTGELWAVEHGPRGGDELNLIRAGANYGFPLVSYGRNYPGTLMNVGATAKAGTQQPIYFWSRAVGPSGLLFYSGTLFPKWRNSVLIGGLVAKQLIRLELQGSKVISEERLLSERCSRIRDVRQGADGAVYVLSDEDNGQLLRLTPAAAVPK